MYNLVCFITVLWTKDTTGFCYMIEWPMEHKHILVVLKYYNVLYFNFLKYRRDKVYKHVQKSVRITTVR